jgi:hypothetical protein
VPSSNSKKMKLWTKEEGGGLEEEHYLCPEKLWDGKVNETTRSYGFSSIPQS